MGEWDHFTRRTETFQKISNMYSYFLYILHCMDFRWWRGGGRMATAAGPSCGPSARGVKPPSVLRPGCCCYMQEIAPVDYWHQAHISSLGGPRHFGTGPGLTVSSLWHCLGHSQASLQCHFSRCKVVSFKGKGVVPPWGDLCVLWHPSEDVDLAHRKVLCHFQAKWVISSTGQSSICERIHLTDDTSLCMRHLNRIWMVMQRFNTYEFAIIGREGL